MAHSKMAILNLFIFLKTTPQCPAGSWAWRSSFRSVGCGLRGLKIFWPNARIFIVTRAALTAVADAFYFHSLTLSRRSPSFKNWLNLAATCATSTQNIIVSLTSLNNTGEQQSSVSVLQGMQQRSMKWRKKSSNALMTSPSFTSNSESPTFFFYFYLCTHDISSYANQSARFISAYHSGLSGSQAVWANRKYHSHYILPLKIIAEVKRSVASS
jgi:hypothetical protein